jgi:arginine decarboxylase-like protein
MAIREAGYRNRYQGVYPITVNQLHEVVEEVLEAGKPQAIGLASDSKAELIATLPHLTARHRTVVDSVLALQELDLCGLMETT